VTSGPLLGLRVVDCSRGTAGPRASGLLADYGADVIWVQPPGGDPWRDHLAVPYSAYNRGKRSVALDLRDDGDQARLFELLADADVFVESWRPGAAERLGVGFGELHRRFEPLVCCSISGFGDAGTRRDVPGYEALVHAVAGICASQPGHREGPIFEGLPFASIGASYLAVIGVLAALYRRGEDGCGRRVETSLFDGALSYCMMWGDTDEPTGPLAPGSYRLVAGTILCGDGEYLGVHTGAMGAFGRLMEVLELDDRIPPSDTGYDMGVPLTAEQKYILDTEMHEIFASQPRAVWLVRLLAADICAIPLLRPGEVFDEPQPRHNEMVVTIDDPVLGRIEQVAPPAKLGLTPGAVRGPAPELTTDLGNAVQVDRWPVPTASAGPRTEPLLAGIRILDFGAYYAGPYSSRLLADLGADVVKVEPVGGDPLRGLARPFRSAQAGKRSLAANLKDPALAPAVSRLVEWADIVHHNLRPGAAERLGLDEAAVRAINPDVIYVYAPGWGSTGPDMNRQSFAPLMSGYVGAGFEVAGEHNPPLFPVGNEDPGNGLLGAVAMMMALLHRQRTGAGQYVENPQLNATMAHLTHIVRRSDGAVLGTSTLDPAQLGNGPLERLYQTSDGWILIVVPTDDDVARLGKAVGTDLADDDRFATRDARRRHADALGNLLTSTFASRSTADWLVALGDAKVPAADPTVTTSTSLLRDPEHHRSGRVAVVPHPTAGHVREFAHLLRVSDAEVVPHRIAPELGEHTDEILGSLGYRLAQIAELRARGAVG
jgi:crotonobetainyl-CoA:carnitine CoA-transferase CaiB-like acyl-CoA transferase